jgi:hypothetical protein
MLRRIGAASDRAEPTVPADEPPAAQTGKPQEVAGAVFEPDDGGTSKE